MRPLIFNQKSFSSFGQETLLVKAANGDESEFKFLKALYIDDVDTGPPPVIC